MKVLTLMRRGLMTWLKSHSWFANGNVHLKISQLENPINPSQISSFPKVCCKFDLYVKVNGTVERKLADVVMNKKQIQNLEKFKKNCRVNFSLQPQYYDREYTG